ncbi:MAG TPA: S41 family peptidase, partial [Pyrinomonadaceae bacterium]|nr:S41 family peptidase [Pyrinomonadaceae bacterium]
AATSGGLKFGDKIIKIDNWDAKSHSLAEVNEKLRGPRGSKFKITIERVADRELQTVEVIREPFPQPTVPHAYMLEAGVGYIDLGNGFKAGSGDAFSYKLQELHNKGMTSLILDLRNNPGGLLADGIGVARQFLEEGRLILTRSNRKTNSGQFEFKSNNRNPDKSPIVVLVNENTGSASEIVAGALQDHKRALIVGETTFGQGVIQIIIPLEYGNALLLTNSKIVLPLGRLVQGDYSNLSFYYKGPPRRIKHSFSDYRGGIEPDEVVRPVEISREQPQMIELVFGFARQLVNGRIIGFNSYEVRGPVDFSHDLKPDEFPVSDSLFNAFKEFVAKEPSYKLTEKQLNTNREFIVRQLRYDIVAAFYGLLTAERVLKAHDPQILRAIEALPRAAKLVTR